MELTRLAEGFGVDVQLLNGQVLLEHHLCRSPSDG